MRTPEETGLISQTRDPRPRLAGRMGTLIALVVLLAGVFASIAASLWVHSEMLSLRQARLDASAASAAAHVERRLAAYAEALSGLRALFQAGEVSRDSFRRYTEALALQRRLPGFQALNYARYVPAASKAAFEAEAGLTITPSGVRDGYHPIVLIEPLAGHEQILGRDIAAAPYVRTALAVARDTDAYTSSGRLIQPRGPQQKPALAMRLPVYRQGIAAITLSQRRTAYLGSVGVGFLVDEAFGDLVDVVPGLRVRLFDGGPEPIVEQPGDVPQTADERLLFDTAQVINRRPSGAPAAEEAGAERVRSVRVSRLADRSWEVEVSAPASEPLSLERVLPVAVGAVGMIASALACVVLVAWRSRRTP